MPARQEQKLNSELVMQRNSNEVMNKTVSSLTKFWLLVSIQHFMMKV